MPQASICRAEYYFNRDHLQCGFIFSMSIEYSWSGLLSSHQMVFGKIRNILSIGCIGYFIQVCFHFYLLLLLFRILKHLHLHLHLNCNKSGFIYLQVSTRSFSQIPSKFKPTYHFLQSTSISSLKAASLETDQNTGFPTWGKYQQIVVRFVGGGAGGGGKTWTE